MAVKPALEELDIPTANSGFYSNFNKIVAFTSKVIIALVVVWAALFPEAAGDVLGAMRSWSFSNLNYYTIAVGFFVVVCLVIAVHPLWGKIKLDDGGKPEFSRFCWFSMMFGA